MKTCMKTWIKKISLIALLLVIPSLGIAEPTTYDVDGDGVENNQDNCPDIYNPIPDGETEQLDFDNDGWGDECDGDDDNDGVSDIGEAVQGTDPFDPDSDDDGVTDAFDCAPTEQELKTYEDCFLHILEGGGDGSAGDGSTGGDDSGGTDGVDPGVSPSPDSDSDGCSDDIEIGMGTDPLDPDTDGDGVPDCNDNCPIVSNPGQEEAEPTLEIGIACFGDYDGDGIPDEEDNCVAAANPFQLDSDMDGVGNVCDPDSVDFGGPEPLIDVQGGGGNQNNGCTLLASAPASSLLNAANGMPFGLMLTTLLLFGVSRKKYL